MSRADRGLSAALAVSLLFGAAIAHGAPARAATAEAKETKEPKESKESLRPAGPVKINADRAEWQKGGSMVYTGNVRLESGDLKLSGDRLQLRQFEDGQFEAKVDGKPAKLDHVGLAAVGSKGNERPPVSARASQLTYDSKNEIVEIAGEALLTRGTDEIRGENIRYDVAQRRIEAQGRDDCTTEERDQGKCRVEITLQPPPRKAKPGAENVAPPAPEPAP